MRRFAVRCVLFVSLAQVPILCSCAYYNTFYWARKYYDRGTGGEPYRVEKTAPANPSELNKAIDYSKKVIANYPKSKWVDDAYLLWARSLMAKDDPLETVRMLEDFPTRFPNSPLKSEALFYLGVAYREARKHKNSVRALDDFLSQAPRHDLAPYAHLERARALMALEQPGDAAVAASRVLEQFPKSKLVGVARIARAEAHYQEGAFDRARDDFRELGKISPTDQDRFKYLLREADALEAGRQFDAALALLRDALSHERAPIPDTSATRNVAIATVEGGDRYGQLMIRIGTVYLMAGRLNDALAAYQRVVSDYPKTALAAEAQYRIGYAYETAGDDFERARTEYARVKDHSSGGVGFGIQAAQRLSNLERLAQYQGTAGDSVGKKSEAGFLLAELYLFQLDKPERALEEYRKVEQQFPSTPIAAKAINAQAWVMSRKLERGAEAESLLWGVVRKYPATEAQLAARDYLEFRGRSVPAEWIRLPERQLAVADTGERLTPPPSESMPLGSTPGLRAADSLGFNPRRLPGLMPYGISPSGPGAPTMAGEHPSNNRQGKPVAPQAGAGRDPSPPSSPADSSRSAPPVPVRPAPSDSTRDRP
jgi:tetratricopeptide (TPR) repeat protein